jgi:type IV pilus assembly protein PilN
MKSHINLASQPFRRDRPVFVASAAVAVVMILLLGGLIYIAAVERGQLADSRAEIAKLERQVNTLSSQQARLESVLRKPENAEVLERSLFLNALLYRKGISWTRIFADLEKAVPYNVRVMSIRPSVNAENQITLDMLVGADSQVPAIELLKNLEASPVFGHDVKLWNSIPPSQTEPLWRFRVSMTYAQKL